MKWYDGLLIVLCIGMTFAVLMIIGAGAAMDIADYYGLNPPKPQSYVAPYGK